MILNTAIYNNKQATKAYLGANLVWQQVNIPTDYVLCYDFNGDAKDKSVNGHHGIITNNGVDLDPPTASRKAGTKCVEFANGCIYTPTNLVMNSNKVAASFWIKTTQISAGCIFELSYSINNNNAFASFINDLQGNKIEIVDRDFDGTYNAANSTLSTTNINAGTWVHCVLQIDRSAIGYQKCQVWINNVEAHSTEIVSNSQNQYDIYPLYIGARNISSAPFYGYMQHFKLYNRILTPTEINYLYNE